MDLVGGRGLPRRLHFIKFVCQNERIGSLRGDMCWVHPPKSANEMQTKTTRNQNGNIGWDHLRGNLSLKKVEMVKTENIVKTMNASMTFADTALRTVKPIPHIPAIVPTI